MWEIRAEFWYKTVVSLPWCDSMAGGSVVIAGASAHNGMSTKNCDSKNTFESYQIDLTILLVVGYLYLSMEKIGQGLKTV